MGLWRISREEFDVKDLYKFFNSPVGRVLFKKVASLNLDEIMEGYKRMKLFSDDKAFDSAFFSGPLQRMDLLLWLAKSYIRKGLEKIVRGTAYGFSKSEEELLRKFDQDNALLNITKLAIKSIAKYGLQKPLYFDAPVMVVWQLTDRCNLKCKHCYENAKTLSQGSTDPLTGKPDELSLEEKIEALDHLKEAGVPTIFFSGGEPLAAPRIWEFLEEVRERGFYFSFASNGTLVTKKVAQKLKDLGTGYYAVSLDAASPELHDKIRGLPGSWNLAVRGIRNLVEVGIPTLIQFTLMNSNKEELEKMFKLRDELGAYKVIVYNYIPIGRGTFSLDLPPLEKEKALETMYEQLKERHAVATTAPQLGRLCKERGDGRAALIAHYVEIKLPEEKRKELSLLSELVGGCGTGRAYCALQSNGEVTPCVYMRNLVVGNIKEKSFYEIWHSPFMEFLARKDDLQDACGNCKFTAVCGGCRARSLYYNLPEELKKLNLNDEINYRLHEGGRSGVLRVEIEKLNPLELEAIEKALKRGDPGCMKNEVLYQNFIQKNRK